MPASPVFILGAARSGTSIMSAILRDALEYGGEHEGHLYNVHAGFRRALLEHTQFISTGFPRPATSFQRISAERIERDVDALFIQYARELHGDEPWVDKTPNRMMVEGARYLERLFPEAHFILMKRRGIENLMSRRRKFADRWSFEQGCKEWTLSMNALWNARRDLKATFVVDQFDLASAPDRVCRDLVKFLGFEDHVVPACVEFVTKTHPERTQRGVSEYVDLEDTGWTSAQMDQFCRICGEAMALWSYSLRRNEKFTGLHLNKWCKPAMDPFREPFIMHPNRVGEPAPIVRYLGAVRGGASELIIQAVSNASGEGAHLDVVLTRGSAAITQQSADLPPGKVRRLVLPVPKQHEPFDIALSVHLLPGKSRCEATGVSIRPFLLTEGTT